MATFTKQKLSGSTNGKGIAVAATSTRAAKAMGLNDRGEIAVGKRADLLSYNPTAQSITLINQ